MYKLGFLIHYPNFANIPLLDGEPGEENFILWSDFFMTHVLFFLGRGTFHNGLCLNTFTAGRAMDTLLNAFVEKHNLMD